MAVVDRMTIEAKHREAAARHPDVGDVPFEKFLAAVSAAVERGEANVEELHASDLYLALACLEKSASALLLLERDVIAKVRPSVERACRDGTVSAEDVMQWTREKLLVGKDGEAPKLAHYTGRGPLVGWVRVVAVREALQDRRRSKRQRVVDDVTMLEGEPSLASGELALLRTRYASAFRLAVQDSIRRLSPEQRSLLRFHTHDGLTIDELAPMLGIHRATVARRLSQARTDALEHTRAILRERLGLSESEARSLCTALGPEVDVSLGRALSEEGA